MCVHRRVAAGHVDRRTRAEKGTGKTTLSQVPVAIVMGDDGARAVAALS